MSSWSPNSAELRSFTLTICILGPESNANYLSSGFFVDAAKSTHSSAGKSNVALSFSVSLYMFLTRFQALLRAHRCCRSISSWDLSSKFHSEGTSLTRNFDIYFSQRWSFLFPDTRMTWRRLSESYPLNWFQDFLHRVSPRLSTWRNECI